MKKQDFCDTYREMYLTRQEFTWTSEEAATRIDYIWVSEGLASGLQKAKIEDIEEITESDHKLIVAEIWVKHMTAESSKAGVKSINKYMIVVTLYFKQIELIVIGVYI